MHFKRTARVPIWIAGVSIFLAAAGGTVAVVRPLPAPYAGVADGSARAQHADTPSEPEAAPTEDVPVRAPVVRAVDPETRGRCRECGVIESIRQLERPAGADRRGMVGVKVADGARESFEFTVRLRDGSTAVFSEATSPSLRAGSRVIVIGGAQAARN